MMDIKDLEIDAEFWACNDGRQVIRFEWAANIGWGSVDIVRGTDGKFVAFTESMNSNDDKAFLKMLFEKLIEKIEVVE